MCLEQEYISDRGRLPVTGFHPISTSSAQHKINLLTGSSDHIYFFCIIWLHEMRCKGFVTTVCTIFDRDSNVSESVATMLDQISKGKISCGNIWRKYAGRGRFLKRKILWKICGRFQGGIHQEGILQHTCLVFVHFTLLCCSNYYYTEFCSVLYFIS